MGSIKNNKSEAQAHPLSEEEFNYLMNINKAKIKVMEEYNGVISNFLYYIAAARLEYKTGDELQFELDLGSEDHVLKVTKL
jgi:hypothetical protein